MRRILLKNVRRWKSFAEHDKLETVKEHGGLGEKDNMVGLLKMTKELTCASTEVKHPLKTPVTSQCDTVTGGQQ